MAVETPTPQVVAQKAKQVGDDNTAEVREVPVEVVNEEVDAQVAPAREAEAKKVVAHETSVEVDKVITDPSSPEAVQVPDAGRGFLDLPVHALDGDTPEAVFDREAKGKPESKPSNS